MLFRSGQSGIYLKTSGVWGNAPVQTLSSSDNSGTAVSINANYGGFSDISSDGSVILIGNGNSGTLVNVYHKGGSTWARDGSINLTQGGSIQSLKISGDGNTILIGDNRAYNCNTAQGAVTVYQYLSAAWTAFNGAFSRPNGSANDLTGSSVTIGTSSTGPFAYGSQGRSEEHTSELQSH